MRDVCIAVVPEASKRIVQRVLTNRPIGPEPGEYPAARAAVRQCCEFLENRHCLGAQWYGMLAAHLHPLGRDAPKRIAEIDLAPRREPELARPREQERGEL